MIHFSDDQAGRILATEQKYAGIRHVPANSSAHQVLAFGSKVFDPLNDEKAIESEVAKVLTGVQSALQLPTGGTKPVVYCRNNIILARVRERLSEETLARIFLAVSP